MTSSERTVWHYRDTGAGRPVVLLHGIGMSHAAWNPVTPYLRETRRVIAFDVAGFGLTFDNTRAPFSGRDIAVPVTVVFGDRDWILTKGSRHRRGLPAHTHWITKPGWGHVPMWIDPAGVAQVIADGTR